MKKNAVFLLGVLILCFSALPASAALIGGPDIIAAPAYVIDDAPGATNFNQQAFDENQNVTLLSDLAVDNNSVIANGGIISAGTVVNSHMIFLNTPVGQGSASDTADWLFDGPILGVMSDRYGTLEVASSSFLGAPGTIYPLAPFNARGMEGDSYSLVAPDELRVSMGVSEPGDWIRVVTAAKSVPEPGTMLLLGIGIIAVAIFTRKTFQS